MKQDTSVRSEFVNNLLPYFNDDSFEITLTFKEGFKTNKPFDTYDYIEAGNEINHLLNIVHTELYGQNFASTNLRLNNAHVFGLTEYEDLQVKMILECPNVDNFSWEALSKFVIKTWLDMDCSGVHPANDIKISSCAEEWLVQCFEEVNEVCLDAWCDIPNWNLELKTG